MSSRLSRFIAAIDQGTTSTRCMLFNNHGLAQTSHQIEFSQISGTPNGWVEHDPMKILQTTTDCISHMVSKATAKGIEASQIEALGITNQRETTVVWDRTTGKPLHNAIVWLDVRTADVVQAISEKHGGRDAFRHKCGLPLSPYFSGVKMRWLLDNVPEVAEAAKDGRAMFGTVDSWLIWNLTGGVGGGVHATDVTNASRTMLMNIDTLQWDQELCSVFGVDERLLPRILPSAGVFGHVFEGPLKGVPIAGVIGDQQSATLGQLCTVVGSAKATYGTGCFMLMNTGHKAVQSKNGLLTTVCYQLGSEKPVYALEGAIAMAGEGVRWLRDNLGIIKKSSEVGHLAAQVPDSGGVIFVPAFTGLLAPHWRSDARAIIAGLSNTSTKSHIARALLEGVCFQGKELLEAMHADSGISLKALRVDGGMSSSDITMQIQADLLGISIERPSFVETTALGAAFAAGIGTNIFKDVDEIKSLLSCTYTKFNPQIEEKEREERLARWHKAVQRSFDLA